MMEALVGTLQLGLGTLDLRVMWAWLSRSAVVPPRERRSFVDQRELERKGSSYGLTEGRR